MSNLEIKRIVAPTLNQSGYGDNIEEQFRNIDDNFSIISNRDFVKGDPGDSIIITDVPLVVEEKSSKTKQFTDEGISVVKCILGIAATINDSWFVDKRINEVKDRIKDSGAIAIRNIKNESRNISILDYFDNGDVIMKVVQSKDNTTGKITGNYSVLNKIVFKDLRFANTSSDVTELDANGSPVDWSTITDCSCCVVAKFDENGNYKFEVLYEMPRLYYDQNADAFCWNINNSNTGMIANGPAGKNGKDAVTHIFMANSDQNPVTVTQYFDPNASGKENLWIPANKFKGDFYTKHHISKGDMCIVFIPRKDTAIDGNKTQEAVVNSVYYSYIFNIEGRSITVYCSDYAKLPDIFTATQLDNLQNYIGMSPQLSSLHVPLDVMNNGRSVGAKHMIWSQKTNGTDKQDLLRISPAKMQGTNQLEDNSLNKAAKMSIDYNQLIIGGSEKDSRGIKMPHAQDNMDTSSIIIGDSNWTKDHYEKGIYRLNGDGTGLDTLYLNFINIGESNQSNWVGSVEIGGRLSNYGTYYNNSIAWLCNDSINWKEDVSWDKDKHKQKSPGDVNNMLRHLSENFGNNHTNAVEVDKDNAVNGSLIAEYGVYAGREIVCSDTIRGNYLRGDRGCNIGDSSLVVTQKDVEITKPLIVKNQTTFKGDAIFEKGLMSHPTYFRWRGGLDSTKAIDYSCSNGKFVFGVTCSNGSSKIICGKGDDSTKNPYHRIIFIHDTDNTGDLDIDITFKGYDVGDIVYVDVTFIRTQCDNKHFMTVRLNTLGSMDMSTGNSSDDRLIAIAYEESSGFNEMTVHGTCAVRITGPSPSSPDSYNTCVFDSPHNN